MTQQCGPFELSERRALMRRGRPDSQSKRPVGNAVSDAATTEDDSLHGPIPDPPRNFDCQNYNTCLCLAAALNWYSFHCQGCNQNVDERLVWRAHQEMRKDKSLSKFLEIPQLAKLENPDLEKVEPDVVEPLHSTDSSSSTSATDQSKTVSSPV